MTDETGIALERRAHRLAWKQGYFVRRRIDVFSDEKDQITDIDVIGIKFDEMLNRQLLVVETKSEKGYSSILKLRGFLDYHRSGTGLIIRPNLTPSVSRFSEQLGIHGLPTSRLEEIEQQLNIDPNEWELAYSPKSDERIKGYETELRKNKYGSETDLRELVWSSRDPFFKAKMLIENIQKLEDHAQTTRPGPLLNAIQWLLFELTCLFSIVLLEMAGSLYSTPDHQRANTFVQRLISGKLSYDEKEKLFDRFYGFIASYTKELKKPLTVKREDFSLVPEYSEQLLSLVNRLIKKPSFARGMPRLLDVYLYRKLEDKDVELLDLKGELLATEDEIQFTLKFVRDVLEFLFGKRVPIFAKPLMTLQ